MARAPMSSLIVRWKTNAFQADQGVLDLMAFSFSRANLRVAYVQPGTLQWRAKLRDSFSSNVQQLTDRDFVQSETGPAAQLGTAADRVQRV